MTVSPRHPSYQQLRKSSVTRKLKRRAHNSTLPVAGKPTKNKGALRKVARGERKAGIRKVNPARKRREFARCYGSKDRVEFVQSLPCVACGIVGFSQNAHVGNGGAGRKAAAHQIVPLCSHPSPHGSYGCHRRLHNIGRATFERRHNIDLDALAADTERRWQSHLKEGSA